MLKKLNKSPSANLIDGGVIALGDDNIPDNEGGLYHVSEVYKIQIP